MRDIAFFLAGVVVAVLTIAGILLAIFLRAWRNAP